MRRIVLDIPEVRYRAVETHLLQGGSLEQAAFVFAKTNAGEKVVSFQYVDWWPIHPGQFAVHAEYHLELDDDMRAKLIKKAHDMDCSLVEFHSHPGADYAAFSGSDFWGLSQFVPHIWWRLKKRPYAAVVVTPSSLDGLAWVDGPNRAEPLECVETGERTVRPTGISIRQLSKRGGYTI